MLDAEKLKKHLGEENYEEVMPMLAECNPELINDVTLKNPSVTVALSILLGIIGIDRLYQGGIKMMLVKIAANILTFGTWYIADFYYTQYTVRQDNKAKIASLLRP